MTKKVYLIGHPLGHSWSPEIHSFLGDYSYELVDILPDEVGDFLLHGEYDGLNVTIPYKREVMKYLDVISPEAEKIGAVNTVVRRGGRLYGYNTDYAGFSYLLDKSGINVKDKKILVLGSGGSSHTVRAVLTDRGADRIITVSRGGEDNYENISRHSDCDVIINTTPLGMYPECTEKPVTLSDFQKLCGVVDIIYNPEKTELILDAEERGIPCASGLEMLVSQAKAAAELFSGEDISDERTDFIVGEIKKAKRNIVLVGMPGCGKTSIGQELAVLLGRQFYDTDEEITKKTGLTPSEIIIERGEEYFRDIERDVTDSLTKESGLVIATGGGTVIRKENRRMMHRNGTVVLLMRPIHELDTSLRPISQKKGNTELWRERERYYVAAADYTVTAGESIIKTAENIRETIGL